MKRELMQLSYDTKMKILKEIQNDLFKRKEVKLVVEADKTPSYEEAKKMLIEQFKVSEDGVVIESVKGRFGSNTFLISARLYDSKEDLEKTEPKPKKKEGEEEKPAESAPAEAPKEEVKEEAPKEEAKVEENKLEEKKE